MTKNARVVSLTAIGVLLMVILVLVGRDVIFKKNAALDCGDGSRRTIDIRDFTTQYSAYSLELEASIAEKGKLSTKITPVQLQQLSEAMQSAREFRKFLVAGYNSCAVTKAQYGQYGARFQALDNLAREMNELAAKPSLPQTETTKLAALISQYGELSKKLGTE